MNATPQAAESIQHLDHTPKCQNPHHRAPAEFFANYHGCADFLWCAPCWNILKDGVIASMFSQGRTAECHTCGKVCATFDDLWSAVPL